MKATTSLPHRPPFPPPRKCTERGSGTGKRGLALALLLLALGPGMSTTAVARDPADLSGYGSALPSSGPAQVLARSFERLTGFLIGVPDPTPEAVSAFLADELAPHVDFAYMAAWAAGRHHRQLDAEQRARLTEGLRQLFLEALARNLGRFGTPRPRIDIYRPRPGRSAGETVVPVRVASPSGGTARLGFRFYWAGGTWRIFDVTANGASALAYYRRHFEDILERSGSEGIAG